MIIYDGRGDKRRKDPHGENIEFRHFHEVLFIPGAEFGYSCPIPKPKDLSGWYKCRQDEQLVNYALTGQISELGKFITNDDPEIAEANKKYLADLRFDTDGIATKIYQDVSGWCLLNVAAATGQAELVNFLLQEVQMDVNTMCYGVNPIFCCFPSIHDKENNCSHDRITAAKALIDNGSDLTHKVEPIGTSVMHTACSINDLNLRYCALELLCENMPDPNIVNNYGINALHQLVISDNFSEMENHIRLLVRSGVDPNHEDAMHRKPGRDLNAEDKRKFKKICSEELKSDRTM